MTVVRCRHHTTETTPRHPLEFPDLSRERDRIIAAFRRGNGSVGNQVQVIASPYRICPLGAHIDHQGGPVLGMTINSFTLMAFSPTDDRTVVVRSANYPGETRFTLAAIPPKSGTHWGVYLRAAVLALKERYPLERGISGVLDGMLPGCGLSSSASVLLAYLHALARVNEIAVEPWEYVRLTQRAEQAHIGLNNGILDQTSIVFGRSGHLLGIDTRRREVTYLADRTGENRYRILVAYSGYSRELTTSGYNSRVAECREAAGTLGKLAGKPGAAVLSDLSPADYDRYGPDLPPHLAKRSSHFFSETQRVAAGAEAWRNGDLDRFGRLMNDSCSSSMTQYECGIEPLYDLQRLVSTTDGVYGSRFMGGGFGGCVVGLVRSSRAEAAAAHIQTAYRDRYPEVADRSAVYLARSHDGVRLL